MYVNFSDHTNFDRYYCFTKSCTCDHQRLLHKQELTPEFRKMSKTEKLRNIASMILATNLKRHFCLILTANEEHISHFHHCFKILLRSALMQNDQNPRCWFYIRLHCVKLSVELTNIICRITTHFAMSNSHFEQISVISVLTKIKQFVQKASGLPKINLVTTTFSQVFLTQRFLFSILNKVAYAFVLTDS